MYTKKLGQPSKNVEQEQATPNRKAKRNPPSTTGIKTDRLYNSPEYKAALKDISSSFQSKVQKTPMQSDYKLLKRMGGAAVPKR